MPLLNFTLGVPESTSRRHTFTSFEAAETEVQGNLYDCQDKCALKLFFTDKTVFSNLVPDKEARAGR